MHYLSYSSGQMVTPPFETRVYEGAAGTGTKLVRLRLTGVFCNSAIKAAERDHEMVARSSIMSEANIDSVRAPNRFSS